MRLQATSALTIIAATVIVGCGNSGQARTVAPAATASPAVTHQGAAVSARQARTYAREVNLKAGDLPSLTSTLAPEEQGAHPAVEAALASCLGKPLVHHAQLLRVRSAVLGSSTTRAASTVAVALVQPSLGSSIESRGARQIAALSSASAVCLQRYYQAAYRARNINAPLVMAVAYPAPSTFHADRIGAFRFRITGSYIPPGTHSAPTPLHLYEDLFLMYVGVSQVGLGIESAYQPMSATEEESAVLTLHRRAEEHKL